MFTLVVFSFAMLVGCYLAGCIPLAFELSDRKLRLTTVMGAGLLVGTALSVIIPEGVNSMYRVHLHSTDLSVASDESQLSKFGLVIGKHHSNDQPQPFNEANAIKPIKTNDDMVHSQPNRTHVHSQLHRNIGLALLSGFVLMLILERIFSRTPCFPLRWNLPTNANSGLQQTNLVSLESMEMDDHNVKLASSSPLSIPHSAQMTSGKSTLTATIGLVVHAAADGIALGAAATVQQLQVETIIFMAIMLHKGPAAFGLVSYLLHEGLDRPRIRRYLLTFSLAAPLAAIVTYVSLSTSSNSLHISDQATGFAMLFSGGTFLYVATVHVLSELNPTTFHFDEALMWLIGALLPLMLSFGHSH